MVYDLRVNPQLDRKHCVFIYSVNIFHTYFDAEQIEISVRIVVTNKADWPRPGILGDVFGSWKIKMKEAKNQQIIFVFQYNFVFANLVVEWQQLPPASTC